MRMEAFTLLKNEQCAVHCRAYTVKDLREHGFILPLAVAYSLGAGTTFWAPSARECLSFWDRRKLGRQFKHA